MRLHAIMEYAKIVYSLFSLIKEDDLIPANQVNGMATGNAMRKYYDTQFLQLSSILRSDYLNVQIQ